MRKKITTLLLSLACLVSVSAAANAQIILADHFDMDHDWSGSTGASLSGITSTDPRGNKWNSIGVNWPAVIDQTSGHTGRGLRFQIQPGDGVTAIGCEMASYPQVAWQGRSQFIGYYSKVSDNNNWGSKGNFLKMLRINMEKNDVIPELTGGDYTIFIGTATQFSGIYRPDNNWHKYLWEFTAQSSPSVADGVIRLTVDDVVVWERTNVKWNSYGTISSGTYFNYGYNGSWYYAFIQGNLAATYNGPTKYMYWDDFIIATTKDEVASFIGAAGAPVADTQAPTVPTGVVATAPAYNQTSLSWGASADNVGVTGYKVYRGGAYLKTVTGTSTTDTGLTANTQYAYTVSAVDAAGNESAQSAASTITTPYAPTTPSAPSTSTGTVLLQEGFNDTSFAARSWFDAGASTAKVVTDASRGTVLQYTYQTGASTPSGAMRKVFPESDDITITYYIKYQSNWLWTGLGYGPHEFYLLTNLDDKWIGPAQTHTTTYLESVEGKQTIAFQDALNIDQNRAGTNLVGVTENRSVFGCNGSSDSYPDGTCYGTAGSKINGKTWSASMPVISNGVWHAVKVHLKMNSIVNGIGKADGVMQYWLDGVPYIDNKNVLIRTGENPNMKWNLMMIAPYFHGGAKQVQSFWIDDLQITTGGSSQTPPAAPTGLRIVN